MRSDDLRAISYRADTEHNQKIAEREAQMNAEAREANARLQAESDGDVPAWPKVELPRVTGLPVMAVDDRGREYDVTGARYDHDGALVLEIVEAPRV